ncbi:hypothetical protein BZG36_03779 [Bifiguratus adelaidae]|uniref:Uncharacterized protein n=1 Tax=Bifiguratus adelaidae TaxID=1938954 RepID=A0A261XXL3_9FUNG|nr:hypothetical protein BZG36_03779 [Bifiguratus adelaidae]
MSTWWKSTRGPLIRSLYSTSARIAPHSRALPLGAVLVGAAGIAFGYHTVSSTPVHSEASTDGSGSTKANKEDLGITKTSWSQQDQVNASWRQPGLYLWGSNRYGIVDPDGPPEIVKGPKRLAFFDGQYLRDVTLAEKHAAAVLINGDVYQWGMLSQIPGKSQPQPSACLEGRDIVQITVSNECLFALSKKGHLYMVYMGGPNKQIKSDIIIKKDGGGRGWWPFSSMPSLPSNAFYVDTSKALHNQKVTSIAAGSHHLLLTTSDGRVFAASLDDEGNSNGQLGIGHMAPVNPGQLHEVAGDLIGKQSIQVVAGERHSVVSYANLAFYPIARTADGRAFTFGSNKFGQLCQGDYSLSKLNIPEPTEVTLLYPSNRGSKPQALNVVQVSAGGNNTYFVVDKIDSNKETGVSRQVTQAFAAGMGQYGQLGNGMWSQMKGSPTKIAAVSDLLEYEESLNEVVPIRINAIHAGQTHCVAVLDNVTNVDALPKDNVAHFGHDVFIWGHNQDGQLGNGKRNNVATPMHALPLDADQPVTIKPEEDHGVTINRLQLAPKTRMKTSNGKKVDVDQKVMAGVGVTAVYSHVDPQSL